MSLHFYSYARKGYEFIDEVSKELKTTDTDKAGRMTKCVFRALRNRLTLDESLMFLAHLPMALKSVFVDGWKSGTKTGKLINMDDFVNEVVKEDDNSAWRDFSDKKAVHETITTVFRVLTKNITSGEIEKIMTVLPSDLQTILAVESSS